MKVLVKIIPALGLVLVILTSAHAEGPVATTGLCTLNRLAAVDSKTSELLILIRDLDISPANQDLRYESTDKAFELLVKRRVNTADQAAFQVIVSKNNVPLLMASLIGKGNMLSLQATAALAEGGAIFVRCAMY